MHLLTQDDILKVYAAAVSARILDNRASLLAGIAPGLVAGLPFGASPGDQVLRDLVSLNAAGKLTDESVPLVIWLVNALTLTAGHEEHTILAAALDLVRDGIGPPLRVDEVIPGRWRLEFGSGRGPSPGHTELTFARDGTFDGTLRTWTIVQIRGEWRLGADSRALLLQGGVFTTHIYLSMISRDCLEGSTSPGERLVLKRVPLTTLDPKEPLK